MHRKGAKTEGRKENTMKRINDIVHGRRAITANTPLRLARHFGTSPQFWMNLQAHFDLEVAQDSLRGRLNKEARPRAA